MPAASAVRCARTAAQQRPDPSLGDDGVVVLAGRVLELLRGGEQLHAGLAELVLEQLGRVAGALALDARLVDRLVGRLLLYLSHRLPQPLELVLDLGPQRAGPARRRPGGGSLDRGQQREVALAPQRPEDGSP